MLGLIEKNGYASLNEHFTLLCRSLEEESILKRENSTAANSLVVIDAVGDQRRQQRDDIVDKVGDQVNSADIYCPSSSSSSTTSSTRSSIMSSTYSSSSLSGGVISNGGEGDDGCGGTDNVASSEESIISETDKIMSKDQKKTKKKSTLSLSKEEARRNRRREKRIFLVTRSKSGNVSMVQSQPYPTLVLSPELFVKMFFVM